VNNEKYIRALGKQIDKIRVEKGLSFQQMALECEMDKAQVYKLCTEGINTTAVTLLKISKGLKVPIADLFNFKY